MSDAAIKIIKRDLGQWRQLSHQLAEEVMGGPRGQLVRVDRSQTVEDLLERLVLWTRRRRRRRRREQPELPHPSLGGPRNDGARQIGCGDPDAGRLERPE